RLELEGLVGFFINTLPLRGDLSGNPGFDALLDRVQRTLLAVSAHQNVPLEMLVEALRPERTLSHEPFFQVVLNLLQGSAHQARAVTGGEWRRIDVERGTVRFDLVFTLFAEHGELSGLIEYRTDLFDRSTVQRLREHFAVLLAGAARSPHLALAALPLLS